MEARAVRTLSIAFFIGLVTGCFGDDSNEADCSPGKEGCACIDQALCIGSLECHSGICIDLGNAGNEMNSGDTSSSGDGDGDGKPGDGDGDGNPGDGDGNPGDGDGSPGDGDGDGECIQTYNPCFDFQSGNLTGTCCQGTACLTAESESISGCVPGCATHSECVTDCCVPVVSGQTYCSPATSICNQYGKCIDTCEYSDDGECDDGGPGSQYNLCEYGTDCSDCGPRF